MPDKLPAQHLDTAPTAAELHDDPRMLPHGDALGGMAVLGGEVELQHEPLVAQPEDRQSRVGHRGLMRAVAVHYNLAATKRRAETLGLLAELEDSLDYDKVVAAAFADDDSPEPEPRNGYSSMSLLADVGRLIRARQLLESDVRLSKAEHEGIVRWGQSHRQSWQELGLFREPDAPEPSAEPKMSDAEITAIPGRLREAEQVSLKYGEVKLLSGRYQFGIDGMVRALEKPSNDSPRTLDEAFLPAKPAHNARLRAALERRLVAKLAELPDHAFELDTDSEFYTAFVQRARDLDPATILGRLEVSGELSQLPFTYNEKMLKDFLSTRLPALALNAVVRLEFRDFTDEEDPKQHKLGQCFSKPDGSLIIISPSRIRELYHEALNGPDEPEEEDMAVAEIVSKQQMEETLVHEFGHGLLGQLPIAARKRWEDQRSKDPTNITPYVKLRHESKHANRFEEDFCDSMAMFAVQPDVLTITSGARYAAMEQLYRELMPNYEDGLLIFQKSRQMLGLIVRAYAGMSEPDLRKQLLPHEYEDASE